MRLVEVWSIVTSRAIVFLVPVFIGACSTITLKNDGDVRVSDTNTTLDIEHCESLKVKHEKIPQDYLNLGKCFELGLDGGPPNIPVAIQYYRQATICGEQEGAKNYMRLDYDGFSSFPYYMYDIKGLGDLQFGYHWLEILRSQESEERENQRLKTCGLKKVTTKVGWVLSPLFVPLQFSLQVTVGALAHLFCMFGCAESEAS